MNNETSKKQIAANRIHAHAGPQTARRCKEVVPDVLQLASNRGYSQSRRNPGFLLR